MKLHEKTIVVTALGCLMLLVGGCSSSVLVDEWSDASFYKLYVQHPGYLKSQITRRRSIEVWSTGKGGRMIWSGTSNTRVMRTLEAVRDNIADLVVHELKRLAIIKSGR